LNVELTEELRNFGGITQVTFDQFNFQAFQILALA
jgi:hypothetical protein